MNANNTTLPDAKPESASPSENHLAPYLLGLAMRVSGKKHNQPDLLRAGSEAVLKHGKFARKK